MKPVEALLNLPGARSKPTEALRRTLLKVLVAGKWMRDKAHLPLTEEHWDVYKGIHQASWVRLQQMPRLHDCRDYNDRIQWLKLFDQREEAVRCADKLGVRDYIRERGGQGYLTQVYQSGRTFEEIDFAALPNAFALKATHDSGSAMLVRDKSSIDLSAAAEHFARSLGRVYAQFEGEWAYAFVPPRIMVEELISPESPTPPSDYRFHCVNGEVRWVQNDIPFQPKMKEVIVDPEGRPMHVHFSSHKIYSDEFTRPAPWEEMSELARTLSAGWKYVRVDMFVSRGRIYAGEITFFPYSGFYKGDGQRVLGQLLDFDRSTFESPLYKRLPLA
jgi:hypothetical protein